MNIIERLEDRITGKAPKGAKRDPRWGMVRKHHLSLNPRCEVCGSSKKPRVHHIEPFHISPHKELTPSNLLTLCENKKYGINCHLLLGHLGNFRHTNPSCESDVAEWHVKLKRD